MFRALPSLACLFSVTVTPSWALAQSNVAAVPLEANDSGYVSLDQEAFSGGVTWNGTYFDVRNQSGSGMGYTHGFTQFGAFRPFWLGDDAFIALNGRLNVMGNGDWGFNSGVVARRLANDANRFYGVNAYYDRDRTYRGNEYTQFGFGFETLGESWDFRANGYIPTGTDTNNLGVVGLSSTPFFFGNRIGFTGYERFEQALSGGDFEFGIPLLPDTSWLRGYAGMYAYQQDLGQDPVGFRGRIEGWVSDDLSVGVQVTHDKQFDTYVNAMVDWRFAGFKPTRYFPNLSTRERMLMPVQRQWRITVGEYVDTKDVLAINPRDDVPYFVVWVDNSNTGPGDGTFENPYSTLPGGTLPNETDMLLVRRGDTTQANPLVGNVVLPDYARMLGEGKAHVFDAYANFGAYNVTLDNAVLPDPAFTNSGAYPFLSSNLGPIVTLGDHNEVSAFVMRNANGAAIRGFGTDGFHLNNLEIAGNLGGGIVINNATASGNITADGQVIDGALITNINRNTVVGYTPIIPGAGNNLGGGIVIDSGAAGLELTISQVSMNSSPGVQQFGVRLVADTGDIELRMEDVQTSGGNVVAGVSLESAGRAFLADVIDLESSNNVGSGIDVLGDGVGSEMTVNLFDPIASGNGTFGLQVVATGGAQIGDPLTVGLDGVNVIDGDFSNSGIDAITVFADGGSHIDLFVDPTLANNAGRHGLRFEISGGSTFGARFEQTTFDNAGSDPLVAEFDGPGGIGRGIFGLVYGANSEANLLFLDSTATNAADDGMYVSASNNGRANISVTNTTTLPTFDNAGQVAVGASAVEVFSQLGGDVLLTLDNATGNFSNPATNNDYGLTVNSTDAGSTAIVQVTDGGFNNAGQNAVSVGATNSGLTQVYLENTNGNNAGADAVLAAAATNGRIDLSLDTGEFDNAGQLGVIGAGLRGSATTGGTFNLCVMDSQFNGALDQGVQLLANNNGLVRAHLENGSADGNGLEGLHILSDTNGTVDFRAVDFTFDGNGLVAPSDGVYVRADNGAAHVGFFSSAPPVITTSASNNTGNGFNFEAVNGAELTAHLGTVAATGNAGYGIRFDASGAGTDTLLLMQGTNDISGNTAGNYSLNYNGVDNAIVTLTGSFNNSGTSGVEVDITNATNAFVSILGNGTTDTIDDNALHGVDVRITGAQQAGVVVGGYSSISRNGIDGVNIVLQDITGAGAVDVLGIPTTLTDMFDNVDDGVDVTFIDSAMGPIDGSLLTGTLPIITINSNVAGILNDCLPLPVNVSINDVAVLPASDGVLIQDMNVVQTVAAPADPTVNGIEVSLNGVTGIGIVTVANNVIADMYGNGIYTAITNNSSLTGAIYVDNTISGNLDGDGVRYEQTGGSVDIIAMLETTAVENAGYGINVDLNGVAGNTLTAPSVVIDGSDIRDNTDRAGLGGGVMVSAVNTDLAVVQIINSDSISGNTGDGIRVFGDNSAITTLNISDNADVRSNMMDGINIEMSNGSDISTVLVENNEVLENQLNGVRIESTLSSFTNILVDNNQIDGQANGDGVLFDLSSGTVSGAIQVSSNGINSNSGNGINFDLDAMTIGQVIIQDNTRNSTGNPVGAVILFDVNGNSQGIQNTSGAGIDITAVVIDLSDPDFYYDTIEPGAATPFDPDSSSGSPFGVATIGDVASTGLTSINGMIIDPGVVPISVGGVPVPGGGIPDDVTAIDFTFSDFNPSEVFDWFVDMDSESQTAGGITGVDVAIDPGIDATWTGPGTATVTFSTGETVSGVFEVDPGNPLVARFEIVPLVAVGGISNNGGDGIRLNQTNGSNIGSVLIDGNTIDGNGQNLGGGNSSLHGVEFLVDNSDLGTTTITENIISGHTNGDGVRLVAPDDTDNTYNVTFARNTIDGNGERGVNFDFAGSPNGTLNATFSNDSITNNGQEGINVNLVNSGAASSFVGNVTINSDANTANSVSGLNNSDISNNGGPGVRIEVAGTNTSSYNLTIGGDGDQNTFDGNVDAGVAIRMANSSTGTFDVENAAFTNTVDGSDPNFSGEGFRVLMIESASINGANIGDPTDRNTSFNGNASHGFSVALTGTAQFQNVTFDNIEASNNTGAGDGFNILREGLGVVDNVIIRNSEFVGNNVGINISARSGFLVDDYTIDNNLVSSNRSDGIRLRADFDARVLAGITDNTITENGGDGIQTRSDVNDVTDLRQVSGTWTGNTITDNAGDGIDLGTISSTTIIGSIVDPNIISNNSQNGIRVNGPGFLQVRGNTINENGFNGIDISPSSFNVITVDRNTIHSNIQDGVQIVSSGPFGIDVDLLGNSIRFNQQDGVEINNRTNGDLSVLIDDGLGQSVIADNLHRGVDILNQGDGIADVTINNTQIERNRREGVYVVNTASTTQTQDSTVTTLASDGDPLSDPRLVLAMNANSILNNGVDSSLDTNGLVLRVGTSGATTSISDSGGFVSNAGGFARGNLTGRGGVLANITNNQLGGSAGLDVSIESFVSSIPSATTGTWTDNNNDPRNNANDVFSPATFQSDPLARLDLNFTGNIGQSIDVTRAGAAYNNNEAVFKSRTLTQDGNDPPIVNPGAIVPPAFGTDVDDNGPFTSGTRNRNAQRQAARNVLPDGTTQLPADGNPDQLPPLLSIGTSDSFLFSGMGASTFRVTDASTTAGFGSVTTGFQRDSFDPFDNLGDQFIYTDANGVSNGLLFGELPFGWGHLD